MVGDLLGFLNGDMPEGHPLHEISAQPGGAPTTIPEVWMLGSSDYSAQLAAHLGLPFSFADFFGNTTEYGPRMAELYRQMFHPSEYLSEPKVNVSLQVICAPTEDEARFMGASRRINKVVSALGLTTGGMISPEEAIDWPLDDQSKSYMDESSKGYIEGDPDQVREGILTAAERYQTADIGIVTNCYYFDQRKRSYKLVAQCDGSNPTGDCSGALTVASDTVDQLSSPKYRWKILAIPIHSGFAAALVRSTSPCNSSAQAVRFATDCGPARSGCGPLTRTRLLARC